MEWSRSIEKMEVLKEVHPRAQPTLLPVDHTYHTLTSLHSCIHSMQYKSNVYTVQYKYMCSIHCEILTTTQYIYYIIF